MVEDALFQGPCHTQFARDNKGINGGKRLIPTLCILASEASFNPAALKASCGLSTVPLFEMAKLERSWSNVKFTKLFTSSLKSISKVDTSSKHHPLQDRQKSPRHEFRNCTTTARRSFLGNRVNSKASFANAVDGIVYNN
jgi:hypothetical protein